MAWISWLWDVEVLCLLSSLLVRAEVHQKLLHHCSLSLRLSFDYHIQVPMKETMLRMSFGSECRHCYLIFTLYALLSNSLKSQFILVNHLHM